MGCGGSSLSSTGYNPEADPDQCTVPRCMCCMFCCCLYVCMPCKGGGAYPQPLRELADFERMRDLMYDDDIEAFGQLQKQRIFNKEPAAMEWNAVGPVLQTGDCILMRGSSVGSQLITAFTGRWSHVGMVYVRVLENPAPHKQILLWESVSHPDDCQDVLSGEFKGGVRLVDLRQRLLRSDSPFIGVVRLGHLKEQARIDMQHRFKDFCKREKWKPYEPSSMSLVRVAFDCGALGHNSAHDDQSYFCSKLVCKTLEAMGIVDEEANAGTVCPSDFWQYNLKLCQGARVGALIYIPRLIPGEGELSERQLSAPLLELGPSPPPPPKKKQHHNKQKKGSHRGKQL